MKISRFLTYLGDGLALLQMLLFLLYTFVLIKMQAGSPGLNTAIAVLTGVYIVFLLIKIAVLNKNRKVAKKAGKISKKGYKYTKAVLKIASASVVIMAVINNRSLNGNVLALVSLCFMIAALAVSILIDVALWSLKRKIRRHFGEKKKREDEGGEDETE
jgi:hypothetical protein